MSMHKNIMMGIFRGQPYPHEKGINLTGISLRAIPGGYPSVILPRDICFYLFRVFMTLNSCGIQKISATGLKWERDGTQVLKEQLSPLKKSENTGTDHHLVTLKNSFNCFLIKRSYFFEEPCLVNRGHLADNHNICLGNISHTFS